MSYQHEPRGWAPQPKQSPAKRRLVGPVGWALGFAGILIGIIFGAAINGSGDPAADAQNIATPAAGTPGSCLTALDLAEADKVTPGSGNWNHVAADCRSKAAPAGGAPAPTQEVAEEPAPQPAPAPAAAEAFGGGTHRVGADIAPGIYRTAGPADDNIMGYCYWARLSDTSGELDSIITNNNIEGPATVTIDPSDGAFETNGCQEWVKQ